MSTPTPLVLIITDDTDLASLYARHLAESAVETKVCANGNLALQEALDHKPRLILLDLAVPHVAGFDLLDILRQTPETAHTKVILLGSLINADGLKRTHELGATGIFIKSHANVDEVVTAVNREL